MKADRLRLDGEKLRQLRKDLWRTREAFQKHIEEKNKASGETISLKTIHNAEVGRPIVYSSARLIATSLNKMLEELIMEKFPTVSFLDGEQPEQETLLQSSFECYIKLFPDERERSTPEDTRTWLKDARLAEVNGSLWREVYAVLHVDSKAIGMAYFSGHTQRDYWFGNYFGVFEGWPRQEDRATDFLQKKLIPHLTTLIPGTKGILFEIEPIDLRYLKNVAKRNRLAGHGDEEQLQLNLEAVARLQFYNLRRAFAVLMPDCSPLPYWQPSMRLPLGRKFEQKLILMVYPFNRSPDSIDVVKAVDFIYDDLYSEAYDGSSSVELPRYRPYVQKVKARVSQKLSACEIKTLSLPSEIRGLLPRAKEEGLWRQPPGDL